MTRLTVNKDKQIIVNEGGIAHVTGFMVRQDGVIQRGNATRKTKKGTTVFCAEFFGEEYPACDTVAKFKQVTGWVAK
jgi:hypothetical protein